MASGKMCLMISCVQPMLLQPVREAPGGCAGGAGAPNLMSLSQVLWLCFTMRKVSRKGGELLPAGEGERGDVGTWHSRSHCSRVRSQCRRTQGFSPNLLQLRPLNKGK